jgi:radical SAM protein with 4Fe4S-binding SPASM domain
MGVIHMKKFTILKKPEKLNKYNTYMLEDLFDKKSIKQAIQQSKIKKLIPNFKLSKIEIHPSGECNMNCELCYGKKLAPVKRSYLSSKVIKQNILEDVRKKLSEEDPTIIISGLYSEPLKNPEIKNILKEIIKYGFRFGLYTNGALLDDEIIDTLTKNLYKKNNNLPSYISINISASMFSNNLLEKVLDSIKKLVEKRNKNKSFLQINAVFYCFCKDVGFLEKTVKKLKTIGVDNIRFSIPWERHTLEGLDKSQKFSKKQIQETIKIFKSLKSKFPEKVKIREYKTSKSNNEKCFSMTCSISISPEGDIYPCPELCSPYFKKRFSYGSVLKNKISDIWQSKEHKYMFNNINPKKENCTCCPFNQKFNSLCGSFYNENKV